MATIRDVAAKAEVSISTVSRVVNGNRPVQPEIRDRVLQVIKELNYRPNFLARGLRQQNTRILGLIVPDNANPFYAELARAIEDAGFAAGYSVILCNSDRSEEKQLAYIDVLLSHKVDGVVLVNMEFPLDLEMPPLSFFERIVAERVPMVVANNDSLNPHMNQVLIDHRQGGCLAGEYLLRLNHRRIGCIDLAYPHGYEPSRIVGFREALARGGIELAAEDLVVGNGRYESGHEAMQTLIERRPDLTAVFVFNDMMALGAISVLRARGMRVPEDISIIGYDNISYASMFEPSLTTIAQPVAAMGQECIAQLIECIDQPAKPPGQVTLPVELIERASCRYL
jgi:LacI family transcriptional regulator